MKTINCFRCKDGKYNEVIEDFVVETPEGIEMTISSLLVLICDKCLDKIIPPASSRRIESEVKFRRSTIH